MPRKQKNHRMSAETQRQLTWICERFGESEGNVIARAIDRMYQDVWEEAKLQYQIDEAEQYADDERAAAQTRGFDFESDH